MFSTEGEAWPAFEKLEKELGEVALHRVSHSGGAWGMTPILQFFRKPPPPKLMPPMRQPHPPFKNGAPHLKNKPPSPLKHETPFHVP